MAQGWRQYLEAGMQVGEMTRAQAQRLVRQLVKEGQVAEERARSYVDDIMARSRKRTDELTALVRREVAGQLSSLGLATKADLDALERKLTKGAKQPTQAKARAKASTGSKTSKTSAGKKPANASASAKSSAPSGASKSGSK